MYLITMWLPTVPVEWSADPGTEWAATEVISDHRWVLPHSPEVYGSELRSANVKDAKYSFGWLKIDASDVARPRKAVEW